jgi:hypothetical protein
MLKGVGVSKVAQLRDSGREDKTIKCVEKSEAVCPAAHPNIPGIIKFTSISCFLNGLQRLQNSLYCTTSDGAGNNTIEAMYV